MASGKDPSQPLEPEEPFHSLISDISSLASKSKKESQSAIEETNRLFAILESMAEGVLVADTEQKVLLLNSSLAQAFEFNKKEAVGRFYWELFRDTEINEMFTTALKEKSAIKKEHALLFSKSVFEIQISPVFTADDYLGVVAVFRDITLLKEFETLRTEFVANVSHELKTPLTSILGFVETLKEGAIEDPEHRLKFLQIIETQSKKLHSLIEDLLFLSRVESAKEPLRLEEVDIESLFEKIMEIFQPIVKEKKMGVQFARFDKPVLVTADFIFLERAVSNLVDNAVKYNREKGQVWMRAFQDRDGVKIEVKDEGIGIAPADLTRIFERFYRVDKSRSRELGGTGLGLSITKHLIERHGGRIEVESALNQGTTFTLILPK